MGRRDSSIAATDFAVQDSSLERALKRHIIAAHNLRALACLQGLTGAQLHAIARHHVHDDDAARQVVESVYAGLWDDIATYDDSHLTLLGWLAQRTERLARSHGGDRLHWVASRPQPR